ncbi:MAG: DUF6090 family protein [Balneola sp.]|jgi:hypothetical protein
MIRFFRNIRQKLLQNGNIRKYFWYALGEVFLVVIGILIALQINNWNEANKTRAIEKQILVQIRNDLNGAIRDIDGNTEFYNNSIESADIILDHMGSNQPYHDSIGVHISRAFVWVKLVMNRGGYESVKSIGIDVISNDSLKNDIINLFEGTIYFHREFESIPNSHSENMFKLDGKKYFKSMNKGFGFYDGSIFIGYSEPIDYSRLRKDNEFRYQLETYKAFVSGHQNLVNRRTRDRITTLIKQIEDEVEVLN